MRLTFLAAASVGAIILLSHGFAAQAAEVKILAGGPMARVLNELGPQFERDSGHKLVTRFAPTAGVKRAIDAGDTFDLAISNASAIDEWIKEGKIAAATRAAVAYAGLGVGVRAGAPKPDIGSVEASKRALLNVKSVAHNTESASAASFRSLLERLGIAEEMKPKLKPMVGRAIYKSLTSGEVEIVVAVVPGIVAAPGVQLVGPFPSELQNYVGFAAGVSTSAKEPEAAQALIKFLTSPAVVPVIKAQGMEPGAP